MTTRTSNINVPGLLRNSLNVGVSTKHAISELIDNSLSAGSTVIRLSITEMKIENNKKTVFIVSDNGCGMNKETLENSGCLHSRTESSSERHGRFGFGGNQAQITLTNLEGPVISLSSDGNRISQLTTDFPEILVSGVYYPHAHGIETGSQHIWDECAINRLGTGTIILTHLPETKLAELNDLIINETVTGLRFMIATTYRAQLVNDVKISIKLNDIEYQVNPIDRLGSYLSDGDIADLQYENEFHEIDILRNTTTKELVAHVISSDGSHTCLDKSKKLVPVVEQSGDGSFEFVGKVSYNLAYSNKWNELQKRDLEQNGVALVGKGQHGIQLFRELIRGTELVRNGKVIIQIPTKANGGGDTAAFKYNDDTRGRFSFGANEQLDTALSVQVNKSQVIIDQIHPNIWKTIGCIRKTFWTKCYNKLDPNKAASYTNAESSSTKRPQPAQIVRTASAKSVSAGGAPYKPVTLPSLLVRSRTQSITESETSESDTASVSDNESTTDEECEPAIVATPDEEYEPAIVAMPIEDIEVAIAMPAIVPDSIREVKPSVQESIVRAKGEQILEVWKNSGKHRETLNEMLDELHIAYSVNCAAKQLQRYLNGMHFENKYYLLIELIQERHPSPEDRMFKGIELLRKYSTVYGTDDVHDF